jgi:hypothetical protein
MALDGTGCFPSYATIAEDSGLSRRSVITHVTKAVEAGMLRVTNRRKEGELNQSNIYQLVMPFDGVGDALGGERPALGGAGDALGGGAGAAPITPQYITPQLTPPTPKGEAKHFEDFWKEYPNTRKTNKPQCLDFWKRNKLDEKQAEVMAGLDGWIKSQDWQKEDGKYIKGPLPWLRGHFWENPPKPPVKKSSDPFAPGYNPLGNVSW